MERQLIKTFHYKLVYVFRINDDRHKGLVKIGETTCIDNSEIDDNSKGLIRNARQRIDSYTRTAGVEYELLYTTLAIKEDSSIFRDHDVHNVLIRSNITRKELNGSKEWFKCDLKTAINAINAVKAGKMSLTAEHVTRDQNPVIFRPEQMDALKKTKEQFTKKGKLKEGTGHMLWNAKMRFGKTLTALQVIKDLNFLKTIIITHRPVVSANWLEDFSKIFYDKNDFVYGSKTKGESLKNLNESHKNFIYFASIQDLRGSELMGGNFNKNEEVFLTEWDFVIIDEAHEGTQTQLGDEVLEWLTKAKRNTKTLYLSGTPFNLINTSKTKFNQEEIYTWDYVMEQKAKKEWAFNHFGDSNPYEMLPQMNIYTYQLADIIQGFTDFEDLAFNFKEYFRVLVCDPDTECEKPSCKAQENKFVHEGQINNLLNLLTKPGTHNYPFSTKEYRDKFRHTLWIVPGVKEAKALSALLKKHHVFGSGAFKIVNVAGTGDFDERGDALKQVLDAITDAPDETRTITLSCGKLTAGVTVNAWSACLMLAGGNSTSAASYLQTIFRIQSPGVIGGQVKTDCYVFDFAPDRTLKMISESIQLSQGTEGIKHRIGEFLNFCPVIGIDGSRMKHYSAEDMLTELKSALIDKVARNGFDDRNLYNTNLLKLDDVEWNKFDKLKKILKTGKIVTHSKDIIINKEGLDTEEYEEYAIDKEFYTEVDPGLRQAKRLRKEILEKRAIAISILRGIAIRIPLMIYGLDIPLDEDIGIENFAQLIDDVSWGEFMPRGVTKEIFNQFTEYFDNEVFIGASKRIRMQIKAIDESPPIIRIQGIAKIFSTFKNPDKETVLTPWRVVNMHLCQTIGGYNFFDAEFKREIEFNGTDEIVKLDENAIADKIYKRDSKVLEINSKTGLYPLFVAFSIYQTDKLGGGKYDPNLWADILKNNIYIICKTKMASAIVKRTLIGFKEMPINIMVYEDFAKDMRVGVSPRTKENYMSRVLSKIKNSNFWQLTKSDRGEIMKFNCVIGNPPYQENISDCDGNNSLGRQLFPNFIITAIETESDYITLITPSRWFAGDAQDGSFIKLREFIKKNNGMRLL
ncbi:MAG: DEAD/DEAH box helicase family protein, partial [Christensenellaceae bacterium]|nr:DEAD/DEAH box helicase family protein [Christensenellaceae bacterium]